jgi:hypothetical protein
VDRLRAALAEARRDPEVDGAYARERASNDALLQGAGLDASNRLGRYELSDRDDDAVRHAEAIADNMSLVLRTPVPTRAASVSTADQLALPF